MIATTAQGRIEGIERRGAWQFRGIPYAAPPVGERRFRPPAPPEGWDGVRSGAEFGPVSWQSMGGTAQLLGDSDRETSEDCLFLNVTTPACDDARRPVLVWVHGGGFVNGSGSVPWYDGTSLVLRGDVVVVSINYRLGALGFLWLGDLDPELRSSGVNGLLDQAAALRWVHDNIAAFGGDPDDVTVFGESAGAMSVSTLLALPAARGLFHRAVAQSGAASNTFDPKVASEVTASMMSRLGVTGIEGLLDADPAALVAAAAKVTGEIFHDPGRISGPTGIALAMPFQPVVDGEWLPLDPLEAVRAGEAADVALLVGTNLDEWNLFRLMSPSGIDHPELLDRLDRVFGHGHRIHDTYAEARPGIGPDDLWSAVLTDATFRVPAIRLVEARAEGGYTSPTFQYLVTWKTPAFGGLIGSCHALEVPFVFGTLGNAGAELFFGGSATPEMWRLSESMQDAWVAFARNGDPNHRGLPPWPAWRGDDRPAMQFDLDPAVVADPYGTERALWDGVV